MYFGDIGGGGHQNYYFHELVYFSEIQKAVSYCDCMMILFLEVWYFIKGMIFPLISKEDGERVSQ